MRVTIATEDGQTFVIDVDPTMELENVAALLEADTGIAVDDQALFIAGRQLTGKNETFQSLGVNQDDILLLRSNSAPTASTSVAGRDVNAESETMRRQLLGNPQLMNQLQQSQPELADAAINNPEKFRELLANFSAMQQSARLQQEREMQLLNADPYNIEAQKKIEEAIRHERVLENMESAMENMPEAFGSVHMLYVNTEVNGRKVKAFVDSGAQATIMSPACAERCGIMRLLDTRFAGMARGVGTAKILGRVHSAQIKMGEDLYLQCSFTIMEGKDVELLFGLDMLKRHQAVIDLAQDALVIQGRRIRFLAEHEIPKFGHDDAEALEFDSQGNPIAPGQSHSPGLDTAPTDLPSGPSFPGAGRALGSSPSSGPASVSGVPPLQQRQAGPATSSSHSEEAISSLIALGVGRAEAIKLLDATDGNVEMAASLLFSSQF
ncbi:DNA damage-inducible protein 1 [Microbotryomycetes sp. JL221]|nr:DNA damage-inducible protein 1 [Microbotryomycetes sp. JL221]